MLGISARGEIGNEYAVTHKKGVSDEPSASCSSRTIRLNNNRQT